MANQRIFLRCKACGDEKFIAKRLAGSFYTVRGERKPWDWQQEWNEWFEKHKWGFCDPDGRQWSLDCFELSYEHVDKDGNPSGV